MTSKTHLFTNAMRVYAAELICSTGVLGFQTFKTVFCIYSCFEKGYPTKLYATMPKGIMGNGGLWYLIEALGVSTT